ncbi:MAG: DUF2336 domain-containing protein [Hyphomonadaceae bacterium]|nr:DUF2336 domain-containing protein [Hyphomonadaceae bacterium]
MSAVGTRFAKLLDLAKAPTSEKRRELLREATDLFFETADVRTSRETGLFDDVLRSVAREMQEQVLVELAERFADAPDAPVQLMHDLAANVFPVAEPVLRRSPVLKEDALVRLVNQQSQQHIRAIAQRDTVSPRVSDAIVSVGDDEALDTLLKNAGAVIERSAMERVVDRARDKAHLHAGVVGRGDIPIDLLNEMYFVVEKSLRAAIMERNATVDPAELDEALARARTRMQARSQTAATDEMRAAAKIIEQKKRAGELKPSLLVSLFRDNQHTAFTLGLAEIVGLDFDTTQAIVSRKDMEALAMVCRACNIERPLFVTIAVLCCGGTDAMSQAENYGKLYTAVPVEAAQRAMRFYKVRKSTTPSSASAAA